MSGALASLLRSLPSVVPLWGIEFIRLERAGIFVKNHANANRLRIYPRISTATLTTRKTAQLLLYHCLAGYHIQRPFLGLRQPQLAIPDLQRHPKIAWIPLRSGFPNVPHEDHGCLLRADDLEHHGGLRAIGFGFGWRDVLKLGPGTFQTLGCGVLVGIGIPAGQDRANRVVKPIEV